MMWKGRRSTRINPMVCIWITIICAVSLCLNVWLLLQGENDHCATLYAWFIQENWTPDGGPASAKYDSWYEKCVVKAPDEAKAKREKGKELLERMKTELDARDAEVQEKYAQLQEKTREIERLKNSLENMKSDLKASVDSLFLKLQNH